MTRLDLDLDATEAELGALLAMLLRATNEWRQQLKHAIATSDDQRAWTATHRPAELTAHDTKQAERIAELGLIRRFREHVTNTITTSDRRHAAAP